jgi:hypothetical protein
VFGVEWLINSATVCIEGTKDAAGDMQHYVGRSRHQAEERLACLDAEQKCYVGSGTRLTTGTLLL